MSLDPRERTNWNGFLELLQPPPGYRLAAALGTSFGLSLDTLVAALLSLCETDAESFGDEPVAGFMSVVRLKPKVRVLVHPGTVSRGKAGDSKFVGLLDQLIVQVPQRRGLFHPKVWVLRFDRVGHSAAPSQVGRIIVSSRNLNPSTSFELAVALEGVPADADDSSPFSADVAETLSVWLAALPDARVPSAVAALPRFVRSLSVALPPEAELALRFRAQADGSRPLRSLLPKTPARLTIVSPFVQADFLEEVSATARELQVISLAQSIDAIDDEAFQRLDSFSAGQGGPVFYQVTEQGDPEGGFIDALHAKMILTEDGRGKQSTLVGSANATQPGWGVGVANTEAVVELQPGIGIDRFTRQFIRESKTKTHPWVEVYSRENRGTSDPQVEAERRLLGALRELAALECSVRYDEDAGQLRVALSARSQRTAIALVNRPGVSFDWAPFQLSARPDDWRRLDRLAEASAVFEQVAVGEVSAFLVIRARSEEPVAEQSRLMLADLQVAPDTLSRRDEAVQADVMASADPAAVLAALVRGLSHLPLSVSKVASTRTGQQATLAQLLGGVSLEQLLQAVAVDHGLVSEIRQLLGGVGGEPVRQLCDDLDRVLKRVHAEVRS